MMGASTRPRRWRSCVSGKTGERRRETLASSWRPTTAGTTTPASARGRTRCIAGGLVETLTLARPRRDGRRDRQDRATRRSARSRPASPSARRWRRRSRESRDRRPLPDRACRQLPDHRRRGRRRGGGFDHLVRPARRPQHARDLALRLSRRHGAGDRARPLLAADGSTRFPGFQAIDPARCMLVDARDLDPDEKALLEELPVIRAEVREAADKVARAEGRRRRAHASAYRPRRPRSRRAAGEPLRARRAARSPTQVREAASGMARSVPIVGLTISAYDPAFDAKGEVPPAVGQLLVDFLAALERI